MGFGRDVRGGGGRAPFPRRDLSGANAPHLLRRFGAAILLFGLAMLTGALPVSAQAPAAPVPCRIGVNIEDLYDLDMAKDTFGAILWIWSLCPAGGPNPLDSMDFPTAATGLARGPIATVDLPDGRQYASRRVQGTFRHNWNMTHYPFDTQNVTILLDETAHDADRLVFEADTDQSFITPDIQDRLEEWRLSGPVLSPTVTDEASTYGMPGAHGSRYAEMAVSFTLERTQILTFLKLTSGIYAAAFIAFLSFFYDSNDRGAFGGKLGLLVGVLFAVLINMRTADTIIGDTGHMTLVTKIHLVTLALIVVLALLALRDRRRSERGLTVRHPDWPTLAVAGGSYVILLAALIVQAANS